MTHQINTTVSDELHDLAKDYNISWAEALRIGLAILLMERGEIHFNNPLNQNRIKILAERANLEVAENGD